MNEAFEYIQAAMWHGTLERAEQILAQHPEAATASIHAAAVSGDDVAVRKFIALDPSCAVAIGGPRDAQPIVYLGLSKYLRLDASRSDAFLRAAAALLDAGADPNAGFWADGEFETAMYGAAGVAHHAALTKLLLERGADPNDEEVVYHSGETYDNDALKLVVETGRVTPENLVLMLIRKHDWHDYEGAKWLLEHGADPNHARNRGWAPLHHAIKRDNHIAIIDLLLDHGADPLQVVDGMSAVRRAARQGRDDVLESMRRRGVPIELHGLERELLDNAGESLARCAGNGNVAGVRKLFDLGVDVNETFQAGDGYWDIAPNSSALHVAAWRAQHAVVKLLLERGAAVDQKDGKGRTALQLAVKACVDSFWTERRAPDSVAALLAAGASPRDIAVPTGYDEIDEVLQSHGKV